MMPPSHVKNDTDCFFWETMTTEPPCSDLIELRTRVNEAVPGEKLRERVRELANVLLGKSPEVLKAAKDAFKRVQNLDWDLSEYASSGSLVINQNRIVTNL